MPKALVEYEGSLLVERAVRTARAVCDPVLVVLGAQAVDVWRQARLDNAAVLANQDWETGMASSLRTRLDNAAVLANKDWETGMASSLRTGLDGLRGWPGRVDAALVLLVDMPGMTTEALGRMAAQAAPDALGVATYDGVRAHPVLLGREHWAGVIETATGDEGGRRYLAAHEVTEADCTGLADPADLDVPPGS